MSFMVSAFGEALAHLESVDARIDAIAPERKSLDPRGRRARPLVDLARRHASGAEMAERLDVAFVDGLARVGDAQVRAFPGNLFWDFDAFAASLYAQAEAAADPLALLDEICGIACRLMELFGAPSPIRFRYVHDFMYGFDWARWVARDPAARGSIGPFDVPFLRYIFGRGDEIVALIAKGDAKYGPISPNEHRNPFDFSRSPRDEQRLLEDLAARGLVPVRAWESEGDAVWDRPYTALREARARELGLALAR